MAQWALRTATRAGLISVFALASMGGCTRDSDSRTSGTVRYGSSSSGLPFIISEESTSPFDNERILARDDWAYIRGTVEAAWDNAGRLLKTRFDRLSAVAGVEIILDSIELYTKNSARVINFELGLETAPKGGGSPQSVKVTFRGVAADVLGNVKFTFIQDRAPKALLIAFDAPMKYAKLQPGVAFSIQVNDILAGLIGVPGAIQALDFVDGLIGAANLKTKGEIQGTTRFIVGEDRRHEGPTDHFSDLEYQIATQVFAKLCKKVIAKGGGDEKKAEQECSAIMSPSGKLLVDEVAQAYNNMRVARCVPRWESSGKQAMENIRTLYDVYVVAPPTETLGVDLIQPGRQLRLYRDRGTEFEKYGDYATVESVDAASPGPDPAPVVASTSPAPPAPSSASGEVFQSWPGECGTLAKGERCSKLRLGMIPVPWYNNDLIRSDCGSMNFSDKWIASFKREGSYKK